jgi:hypothetical protein
MNLTLFSEFHKEKHPLLSLFLLRPDPSVSPRERFRFHFKKSTTRLYLQNPFLHYFKQLSVVFEYH